MTPELDPAGWWPDRDTHDVPRARAPYRVRFLRRRADRRRLRAVLLQAALLSILCGTAAIGAAAAEIAADRIYDGTPDTTTPPWCWVTSAPEGFQQCEVTE